MVRLFHVSASILACIIYIIMMLFAFFVGNLFIFVDYIKGK